MDYRKSRLSRLGINGDINNDIYDLGGNKMKLQNKATGEIGKVFLTDNGVEVAIKEAMWSKEYNSLAELNDEWEDYEEPKKCWFINPFAYNYIRKSSWLTDKEIERAKELGFDFETKEEAEKAIEKLKAWKRLKDRGFRFTGFDVANLGGDNVICGQAYFKAGNYDREEIKSDLDLLFGGEE